MYQDEVTAEAVRLRRELGQAPDRIGAARDTLDRAKVNLKQAQDQSDGDAARVTGKVTAETNGDKLRFTNESARKAEVAKRLDPSLRRQLSGCEDAHRAADADYEMEATRFKSLKYQASLLTAEIYLLTEKRGA